MKKHIKKYLLSMSAVVALATTAATIVSCSSFAPKKDDEKGRKELSGKTAYNIVLNQYYNESWQHMIVGAIKDYKADVVKPDIDPSSITDNPNETNPSNITTNKLAYNVFQWYVHAQALKDSSYWGGQYTDWIKNGVFIDKSGKTIINGVIINDVVSNEKAVKDLFTMDPKTSYWILKNDTTTFNILMANPGAGVAMSIHEYLYTMSYLFFTKPSDVVNFENGTTTSPKGDNFKTEITNNGAYYFIDYLRQNDPFIMWKNVNDDPLNPSKAISPGADPAPFNKLSNTEDSKNAIADSLFIPGVGTDPITGSANALTSYQGLQSTNPFTSKGGDIYPDDQYIKDTSAAQGDGGKQGWLNDNGSIKPKGQGVVMSSTEIDYVYVQQLLPKYDKTTNKYAISNWMATQNVGGDTKVGTASISALWSIAFQLIFSNGSLTDKAKSYWTANGYYIDAHIPVLVDNLEPAHIYKPT